MDILMGIWTWIANNILTQPAYFIGVIVVLGYALLKKPWYDILAGFIKAVIGYQILAVGSSGLTNAFRPILVGLQERLNMSAMVIDPYFGQNAVQAAMEGRSRAWRSTPRRLHHIVAPRPSIFWTSITCASTARTLTMDREGRTSAFFSALFGLRAQKRQDMKERGLP